ncbi:MAG: hypothetical protein KH381_01905 [Clostridium sp.]|nr:hypothetical protein [Clostridium sp.]
MIHVDGKKLEARGNISDLLNDATQALAGAATIALNAAKEEGVPDKELESTMDDLLNFAVDGAKKLISRNLEGLREAAEGIELVNITKEGNPGCKKEKSSVPEL